MSFGDLPTYASLVRLGVNITGVVAIDEKCRLDVVISQKIQNLIRVNIGAVVECQGERVGHSALT